MSPRKGQADLIDQLKAERDEALKLAERASTLEADMRPVLEAHHEREDAADRAGRDADFEQARPSR